MGRAPARPVKILVSAFTAWIGALSSTNRPAVQLPRDISPGISITRPTLRPVRSISPLRPSSIRMPAQVWQ